MTERNDVSMMALSSSAFEDGQEIPQKYGKKIENVSPQLSWRDAPRETKSFALSVVGLGRVPRSTPRHRQYRHRGRAVSHPQAAKRKHPTIIVVGLISLMSVVTLRQDFEGAGGADSGSLDIAGKSLVAFHDWTFLLGPAFCAGFGNGLLLGYLMYTSGLVPRRMALLGLIGGPLALASATAVLFGAYEQLSAWATLVTLPEIVWELFLGIYLTVKGFKPSPILSGDARPVLQTS